MSFDLLDSVRTNGQRNPKATIEQRHSHHTSREINILVLGMHGTGKTALTVRYLTRRFIGDYDSEVEMLYSHATALDGKHVTLHILDTVGQVSPEDVSTEQVLWADGVFLVYAINDSKSFDLVKTILDYVQQAKGNEPLTIALIANKSDLIDRKQISDTEVSRLCAEYSGILFFETSASEGHSGVVEAFMTTSREIRLVNKKREKLTRFMSNPAIAAKLQIQQSWKNLERSWRARTSTL